MPPDVTLRQDYHLLMDILTRHNNQAYVRDNEHEFPGYTGDAPDNYDDIVVDSGDDDIAVMEL
jgi:hypothetical protein